MNITEKEALKGVLMEYFMYNTYEEAILCLKRNISENGNYSSYWNSIKKFILNREFQKGEPLGFITINANLLLDENTDEEAYKWLELMIQNVETENNDDIVEY